MSGFKLKSEFLTAALLAGAAMMLPACALADPSPATKIPSPATKIMLPGDVLASLSERGEKKAFMQSFGAYAEILNRAQQQSVVEHSFRDMTTVALKAIVKKSNPNADFTNLGGEEREAASLPQDQYAKNLILTFRVFEMAKRHATEQHSYAELMDTGLKAMLQSLDPHSNYFNPSEWKELMEEMTGSFGGIGVEIKEEKGVLKASKIMPGNAAEAAGMKAGDEITHVGGKTIAELGGLRGTIGALRGEVDKSVDVTIHRPGEEKSLSLTLVRRKVEVNPVSTKRISTSKGDIGVITLTQFSATSHQHFVEEVEKLKASAKKEPYAYVLDLRSNGGGSLENVNLIADELLEKGVVSALQYRGGQRDQAYYAHKGDILNGKRLIVLTNRFSASASEILSGALKDNGRAFIMNADDSTFGKGSGQHMLPLGPHGGMNLTTFYFLTANGSPHKVGVKPDIKVELSEAARPHLEIPEGASPEEAAKIRESFDKFMSKSEATMDHVLPEESAIVRKDPPPQAVCRVASDNEKTHYSIARQDIVPNPDKGLVDETLVCALELLAGTPERATITRTRPLSAPSR